MVVVLVVVWSGCDMGESCDYWFVALIWMG